jgi:hypothetical protein
MYDDEGKVKPEANKETHSCQDCSMTGNLQEMIDHHRATSHSFATKQQLELVRD